MHDKYLGKMEKALNLWVEDRSRKHILTDGNIIHQKELSLYEDLSKGTPETSDHSHITFVTVYCYNCSILLFVIVSLLPCLIYKDNFITGLYVEEKT